MESIRQIFFSCNTGMELDCSSSNLIWWQDVKKSKLPFCDLESFSHYVVFLVVLVSPLINCETVFLLTYLKFNLADEALSLNEIQLFVKQFTVPSYMPSARATQLGSRRSEENLVNAKSLRETKFYEVSIPVPQTLNPTVSPGK